MRKLELRPCLNAGVEFVEPEVKQACLVLLKNATELRTVTIGWSEAAQTVYGSWRPWAYKAKALDPIRLLVGKVELVVGEVSMPPPRFKEKEQAGLEKAFARIVKS